MKKVKIILKEEDMEERFMSGVKSDYIKLIIKQKQDNEEEQQKPFTPSDLKCPVWVMSPPLHAKFVPNNAWMIEYQEKFGDNIQIDIDAITYEWSKIYEILVTFGLVLLLPPVVGLQDLHYVNSFVYLPHIKDKHVCIISRFKSDTRKGEEAVVKQYLESIGYECHQPPLTYNFEGEPCLRWLRDNIYLGSYGMRTSKEALHWIESNFDCEVIKLGIETGKLFHGDCIFFPLTPYDVVVGVKHADPVELKKLENYANIIPVENEELLEGGVCNGIVAGGCVLYPDLTFAERNNLLPQGIAKKTKDFACKVTVDLGLEPIFIRVYWMLLQGALLSCCVARLNWYDRLAYIFWKEGLKFLRNNE